VTASPRVVIGADTHLDSHHLVVSTNAGKPLADTEFPTSQAGYDDAVRWAQSFGTIVIAGVEGTSSYGAGLTWVLQARRDRGGRGQPPRSGRTPPPRQIGPAGCLRRCARRAGQPRRGCAQRRKHRRLAGAAERPAQRGQGPHYGVGADTAAQLLVTAGTNPHRLRNEASFAALCGAAPVPASSGKITRHRLSRGGDRAANNALYRIALVRMSAHPQTRD
jgi:transposase